MDPENTHYHICDRYHMSYLHYVYPMDEYMHLSNDEVTSLITYKKLLKFKEEMAQRIKNVATKSDQSKFVNSYGLLDYVVLGNIPFGADALFKLGYKASEHGLNFAAHCNVSFYHPDGRSISYHDINGHDFCRLWKVLKNKEEE